jgi:hypothetical protein
MKNPLLRPMCADASHVEHLLMFVRINVLSVEVALRVLVNHGCFPLTLNSRRRRKCQVGDLLALMENKKLATFPVIDSIESCKLIGTWRWCAG